MRTDPIARRIVLSWRRLTEGTEPARTVVACSGGADSSALLLALAGARLDLVAGHVVHDLRSEPEALADLDATKRLAARLGVPIAERRIRIESGNREARSRELRYQALTGIAREHGASFVATAHHADDQLETMIMALIRGAGVQGLRGLAPWRGLDPEIALIRPMLRVTHEEAIGLCERAGIEWSEDASNLDTTRLRAALRHGPLARIAELRSDAALHAARSADQLRDAAALVEERTLEVFGEATSWRRERLQSEWGLIVGTGLRIAALRLTGGRHADAMTSSVVDPAVRAIRDDSTDPRSFDWPGGLTLCVTAHEVALSRAD